MKGPHGKRLPRRALILAAGVGSRLRPLTDRLPKCLVPVAGRPLLAYWIDALTRVGVRDIWINSHAHAEQVRSFMASYNARACGVRLHECYEPVLLGSAGTVTANRGITDGASDVVVVYADNFSLLDLRRMLVCHEERHAAFTMALFEASNPAACGIAELEADGRIVRFEEKPAHPRGNLANAGIYVLAAPTYREIADLRAFDFGFDVIRHFVGRMHGYRLQDYFIDVGTPEAYRRACDAAVGLVAALGQTPDGRRRAVFIARDTMLEEPEPDRRGGDRAPLVAGCGRALRALRDAGMAVVVYTGRTADAKVASAIHPRGHEWMYELLADEEVTVDAVYEQDIADALPHAARELGLALERSYAIGAAPDDARAAMTSGCTAAMIVLRASDEQPSDARIRAVPGLAAAAERILANVALLAGQPAA